MIINSFIYLIIALISLQVQSFVTWVPNDGEDSDHGPVETLLSKLFGITQNLYRIDDFIDTVIDDEQTDIREDNSAQSDKTSGFLEQAISVLNSNNWLAKQRNFKKGNPVSPENSITIEQHVCVREKQVPILWKDSESSCTSYNRAMRCVTGENNETLIRIIECCDGYHTSDIKKGCTSYDIPKTLNELLDGKNICIESLKLDDAKFTTLLIPGNESCSVDGTDNRDWDGYFLNQRYRSYEMLNSQKLATRKPGAFVIVSRNPKQADSDDKPFLNCVRIVNEDLEWSNGTVQILSAPLPESTTETLFDVITNDPNFSTFNALLSDDLYKRLASNNIISTAFVFTNEIFSSLSSALQTRMLQKKGCARELIKEHIYDSLLCSPFTETDIKSITGIKHHFYKQRDENGTEFIRVDNAKVLTTNRVLSNGVIHIIDDIILREQSAIDWHDHLNFRNQEFLEIVERNIGYEDEPIAAIFIPPTDSFHNLTDERSFVLNHIVLNDSYITNKLIETAYGSKIPSSVTIARPVFGCAKAIKSPTKYCNTTIYFIDAPLPMTKNTLEELITGRHEFSVFASLLNNSKIDLENDRLYTVFLPSDDALSRNQIRALKMNETLANNFVRRHIFEGLLCSKNFQVRTSYGKLPVILKNIKGEYYNGRRMCNKTTIGDISLQDMDILAINGILHILESPLKSVISIKQGTLCSPFDFA